MPGFLHYISSFLFLFLLAPFACADEIRIDTGTDFTHAILEEGRVSANFGVRRNPFNKEPGWHSGVDLAAQWDAPIFAPGDGIIKFAGARAGYGKVVELKLQRGWVVRFSALNQINVETGDKIAAGQKVGSLGSTGRATGPHLHLEVLTRSGRHVDPKVIKDLTFFNVASDQKD